MYFKIIVKKQYNEQEKTEKEKAAAAETAG